MKVVKEQETENEDPTPTYQAMMAAAYTHAKEIAVEVFGGKPSRALINAVYDKVVYIDEDAEINHEDTESSKADLIAAKAWAKDVYGDDSPEATLDAYDRAFDLTSDEDDDE